MGPKSVYYLITLLAIYHRVFNTDAISANSHVFFLSCNDVLTLGKVIVDVDRRT
jgi:hypothetical protein